MVIDNDTQKIEFLINNAVLFETVMAPEGRAWCFTESYQMQREQRYQDSLLLLEQEATEILNLERNRTEQLMQHNSPINLLDLTFPYICFIIILITMVLLGG